MKELISKIVKIQGQLHVLADHITAGNIIPAVDRILGCDGFDSRWPEIGFSGSCFSAGSTIASETWIAANMVMTALISAQALLQRDHGNSQTRFLHLAMVQIRKAQLRLDQLHVTIDNWL